MRVYVCVLVCVPVYVYVCVLVCVRVYQRRRLVNFGDLTSADDDIGFEIMVCT